MSLREVVGDDLYLSVSQLKTYLRCPRSFELRYVRGLKPEFIPYAMAFGTAMHSAFAGFYSTKKGLNETADLERLIELFRQKWTAQASGPVPVQLDEDDDAKENVFDLARRMLTVFHAHAVTDDAEVVAVEHPFSVSLFDPDNGEVLEEKLVGVFDLLVWDGGVPVVVEHKTSARKYGMDQVRWDFQPTAYLLAAKELGHEEPGVRLQVVTKTKTAQMQVEVLTRSIEDEDDFRRVAIGVLRAIDSGAFYPLRGWHCRTCPYQKSCGARR